MSTASTFFRNNAEEALQKLNGTTIGKQMVRLSWGRNPANKQVISLSLFNHAETHILLAILSGVFPPPSNTSKNKTNSCKLKKKIVNSHLILLI